MSDIWMGIARAGRRLFGRGPEDLIAQAMLLVGTDDFRSDAEIWSHRKHLTAPTPLKGDGSLVDFRRWSTRFWPPEHGAGAGQG
jgi:hypothetical protein